MHEENQEELKEQKSLIIKLGVYSVFLDAAQYEKIEKGDDHETKNK